jgi:hypothetical protein
MLLRRPLTQRPYFMRLGPERERVTGGAAWRRHAMVLPITQVSPYTSLFSFLVGIPAMVGAYYQSWKARQEARLAREGAMQSANCLEFVLDDGTCVNLVPLETLHSLPKPGDVVLLPGDGTFDDGSLAPGAYRIDRIEHIYTVPDKNATRTREARLTKAVAQVTSLSAAMVM